MEEAYPGEALREPEHGRTLSIILVPLLIERHNVSRTLVPS
jgi:hypothetical protein